MHLLFYRSSSVFIIPLKQLPISIEHGVKDQLVMGHCSTGFRRSIVEIQIFKIKRVEYVQQQSNDQQLKTFDQDPCQSVREIFQTMSVSISTILNHLKKIGKVKKLCKWVLHSKVKELDVLKRVQCSFCRT